LPPVRALMVYPVEEHLCQAVRELASEVLHGINATATACWTHRIANLFAFALIFLYVARCR
jgi:hypothetical protein